MTDWRHSRNYQLLEDTACIFVSLKHAYIYIYIVRNNQQYRQQTNKYQTRQRVIRMYGTSKSRFFVGSYNIQRPSESLTLLEEMFFNLLTFTSEQRLEVRLSITLHLMDCSAIAWVVKTLMG